MRAFAGFALGSGLCVLAVVAVSLVALDLPRRAAVEPPQASAIWEYPAALDNQAQRNVPVANEQPPSATPEWETTPRTRAALREQLESRHVRPHPAAELQAAGWPVRAGARLTEHATLLLIDDDFDDDAATVWIVTETPQVRLQEVVLPPCAGTALSSLRLEAPPYRDSEPPRLLREYAARATALPSALELPAGPRIIEAWSVILVDDEEATSPGDEIQVTFTLKALTHALPTSAAEWVAWIETCLHHNKQQRAARALELASQPVAPHRRPSFYGALSPAAYEDALARLARDLDR